MVSSSQFDQTRTFVCASSVEREARPRLAAFALDLEPTIPSVEALSDRWRRPRGSAEAFHLLRPEETQGGVGLMGGFLARWRA
jgi:hypothetical protein